MGGGVGSRFYCDGVVLQGWLFLEMGLWNWLDFGQSPLGLRGLRSFDLTGLALGLLNKLYNKLHAPGRLFLCSRGPVCVWNLLFLLPACPSLSGSLAGDFWVSVPRIEYDYCIAIDLFVAPFWPARS